MVHLQNCVLLHHPEEHEQTQRGVKVQRSVREPEREKGERDGQRQRKQDDQRITETFVICRQDHVHEHDREQESPEEFVERRFEFVAASHHARGVAGREVQLGGGLAQCRNAIGESKAGRNRAPYAVLALAIEPVDAGSGLAGHELNDVVEPNERACFARNVKTRNRFVVFPIAFAQTKLHIVIVVHRFIPKARDFWIASDHEAQSDRDVRNVHAQIGRAGAIDDHADLGRIEFQRGVGIENANLGRAPAQLLGVIVEPLQIGAEQREFDLRLAATNVERAGAAHGRAQRGIFSQALPNVLHDLLLGKISFESSLRTRVQQFAEQAPDGEHALVVRQQFHIDANLVQSAQSAGTDGGEHGLDARHSAQFVLNQPRHLVHRNDAQALGRPHKHIELAFVGIARDVFLLDQFVEGNGGNNQRQRHDSYSQPIPHGKTEQMFVSAIDPRVEADP